MLSRPQVIVCFDEHGHAITWGREPTVRKTTHVLSFSSVRQTALSPGMEGWRAMGSNVSQVCRISQAH